MADKTWKKAERRVAAFFRVPRNPLSGSNSGHTGADTIDPLFYSEVKYRQAHAALTLLDETAASAEAEPLPLGGHKVPVVAMIQARRRGFGLLIRSEDVVEFCIRFLGRMGYVVRGPMLSSPAAASKSSSSMI